MKGAMFQTFDAPQNGQDSGERVARLRELMQRSGVDALLVPHTDEYQNEYVPPCGARLAWLTGFNGSAGLAVVARKTAALFVDGRYILQAPRQVDTKIFEVLQIPAAKAADWIGRHLKPGAVLGFDPKLHTPGAVDELTKDLEARRIKLKPLPRNLVDRAWGRARPGPPQGRVVPHPLEYAGKPAKEKLAELQATLKKDGQDAAVITAPDSIAWLFNIRGSDVAHNPVVLATAIVPASGKAELFIDRAKVGPEAKAHLAPLARINEPAAIDGRLVALKEAGKTVRVGPGAPFWFSRKLQGGKARVIRAADPCVLPKARKNATEIEGARRAHKRDGVALARFLAWLDREAETGGLDEIAAARRLEMMRAETQALKEISFDTISGAGPNGAIVHYRVTTATNRRLAAGELYLVDSGAQYLDGTTDVTRTVPIGRPTREMQERFTRVLKGHIAIATARFPKGTRGVDLDPFARRALWDAGLDFDHGTGHGIGSYLSVHEGPARISKLGSAALKRGMILSNEPGYYKTGAYGIRIENLVLVVEAPSVPGGEKQLNGFETLTLAPIDRRLVIAELLTPEETAWLDSYHARVAATLSPLLDVETQAWLAAATRPLRPH